MHVVCEHNVKVRFLAVAFARASLPCTICQLHLSVGHTLNHRVCTQAGEQRARSKHATIVGVCVRGKTHTNTQIAV